MVFTTEKCCTFRQFIGKVSQEVRTMPLLNFTRLINQVLDHSKTQTIRLPRKIPFVLDDTLHVYVQVKLGTARLTGLERKEISELTHLVAMRDGFDSYDKMLTCLKGMHPKLSMSTVVDVLTFVPDWKPQRIVEIQSINCPHCGCGM